MLQRPGDITVSCEFPSPVRRHCLGLVNRQRRQEFCHFAADNFSGSDTDVGKGSVIGRPRDVAEDITLVGVGLTLPSGTVVPAGAKFGASDIK